MKFKEYIESKSIDELKLCVCNDSSVGMAVIGSHLERLKEEFSERQCEKWYDMTGIAEYIIMGVLMGKLLDEHDAVPVEEAAVIKTSVFDTPSKRVVAHVREEYSSVVLEAIDSARKLDQETEQEDIEYYLINAYQLLATKNTQIVDLYFADANTDSEIVYTWLQRIKFAKAKGAHLKDVQDTKILLCDIFTAEIIDNLLFRIFAN